MIHYFLTLYILETINSPSMPTDVNIPVFNSGTGGIGPETQYVTMVPSLSYAPHLPLLNLLIR